LDPSELRAPLLVAAAACTAWITHKSLDLAMGSD
jgi:hypothetical protein